MSVLLDSNIPMYLVGAEHPYRHAARRRLEELITAGERLVTDVEVLQEILHRYVAIRRPDAIQPAFNALLGVVDEVLPVTLADAQEAKQIVLGGYGVSARDALHLAVMQAHEVDRILTFDNGFDKVPGVNRIS